MRVTSKVISFVTWSELDPQSRGRKTLAPEGPVSIGGRTEEGWVRES